MGKASKNITGKAPVAAAVSGSQKKSKKRRSSNMGVGHQFRSTVKRILRVVDPKMTVVLASSSVNVLCAICHDFLETTAETAGTMAKKLHKQTVGSEDIIASIELNIKGDLKKCALKEVNDALNKGQIKPSDD